MNGVGALDCPPFRFLRDRNDLRQPEPSLAPILLKGATQGEGGILIGVSEPKIR